MRRETKLHRAHLGVLRFTLWQRIVMLFAGRLYFTTRKAGAEIEVAWSVFHPRALSPTKRNDAAA